MEKIYALIKDGVVVNTIVSTDEFNALIANQYDAIIRIDEMENKPGINFLYENEEFIDPDLIVEELPPEEGE